MAKPAMPETIRGTPISVAPATAPAIATPVTHCSPRTFEAMS